MEEDLTMKEMGRDKFRTQEKGYCMLRHWQKEAGCGGWIEGKGPGNRMSSCFVHFLNSVGGKIISEW